MEEGKTVKLGPLLLTRLLAVDGEEIFDPEVSVLERLVPGALIEVDVEKMFDLDVSELLLLVVVGRKLAAAAVLLSTSQSPVAIRTVTTDGAIATGRVRIPKTNNQMKFFMTLREEA